MSLQCARFFLMLGSAFALASAAHADTSMFQAWFHIEEGYFYPDLPAGAPATGPGLRCIAWVGAAERTRLAAEDAWKTWEIRAASSERPMTRGYGKLAPKGESGCAGPVLGSAGERISLRA